MTAASLALLALATTFTADAARPKADLEVALTLPTFDVDQAGTIDVDVDNIGNRKADNVWLTIVLPQTATSPTVHPMGVVSNLDSRCFDDHTLLKCNLGRLSGGAGTTVSFDMALPQSAADIDFFVSVATNSAESSTSNNTDDDTALVLYPDLIISGPVQITNQHCTGQGLSAFYECSLYPSSISSHQVTLDAGGTISGLPSVYTGSWGQLTDDSLWFEYELMGQVRLSFEGNAVDGSCFEGLSTFPGSPYVAPYRVCL